MSPATKWVLLEALLPLFGASFMDFLEWHDGW